MWHAFDWKLVKGKKGRYAYYRCRKVGCRAVNVPRERLEKEFASLLEQVTPDRRYMRLFAEIVRRVWKQRQESSVAVLNAVTRRLRELTDRKNTLVDFLLMGRLDQQLTTSRF